ncbi:MAG: hypothetical protein IT270_12130 [Saprospiraceae bacterium]|nr:hypothetical protein [Saprospiraceae bacterium]
METNFTQYLLQAVQQALPPGQSMPRVLTELLNQSASNVYRKIRGDVPFTLDDVLIIARQFNISLDAQVLAGRTLTNIQYPALYLHVKSPEDYLNQLSAQLDMVGALPTPEIVYAAQETPLFYYMLQPELLAFKLFMWHKTHWSDEEETTFPVFSYAGFLKQWPNTEPLSRSILKKYFAIPAVELRSVHALSHTLRQIQVARQSRFWATDAESKMLVRAVGNMVDTFETMLRSGKRTVHGNAPLKVYFNDIEYTNNTVLISSNGETVAAFTAYDNPNFLVTRQSEALVRLTKWIENVRRLAVPVSSDGERHRTVLLEHFRRQLLE